MTLTSEDRDRMAIREKYATSATKKLEFRVGDVMISSVTKVRPAIIDYDDIFAMTTVENDNHSDAPWDDCDGWEHSFVEAGNLAYETEIMENAQGVVRSRDRHGVILINTDDVKKKWMGEYSPFSGESRQVYEERIARTKRKAIEQLVDWYENGWSVWVVSCEFLGADESVGGVWGDDSGSDEHVTEMRHEIAGQVAGALKKRGFEIVHEPPAYDPKVAAERNFLGFENFEAYRRWVKTR